MLAEYNRKVHRGTTDIDGGSIVLERYRNKCVAAVDVLIIYDGTSILDSGSSIRIEDRVELPADAWEKQDRELLKEIYELSGINRYL